MKFIYTRKLWNKVFEIFRHWPYYSFHLNYVMWERCLQGLHKLQKPRSDCTVSSGHLIIHTSTGMHPHSQVISASDFRGPRFELRQNSAHYYKVLHYTELFIITASSTQYGWNNVEREVKHQITSIHLCPKDTFLNSLVHLSFCCVEFDYLCMSQKNYDY